MNTQLFYKCLFAESGSQESGLRYKNPAIYIINAWDNKSLKSTRQQGHLLNLDTSYEHGDLAIRLHIIMVCNMEMYL